MHLTIAPELGLGSNQVLFGGIICPLSATSITSSIWTAYIAKAHLQSVWHRFSSSPKPLIPPTKSIRFEVRISCMSLYLINIIIFYQI